MTTLSINITGMRETREALAKVRVQRVPAVLRRIAQRGVLAMKRHATATAGGEVLKRRSASLLNHIQKQEAEVSGQSASWGLPEGELQSRIGAFLESGGTILPRTAKMLRIPLDAAKTSAGVDRYAGVPLRTAPGFFLVKSGSGKLLLGRREDNNPAGAVRWWYVLKHRVEIRPHPWFSRAVARTVDDMRAIIDRTLGEEAAK